MTEPAPALTPMMRQLEAARARHPGMMVFFQNGEFYELFGHDAVHGSKILGITLTKREDTPMAGFPLAKLEHYLRLLLAAGERVAVVEQLETPGEAGKKIIKRDVTRVVTPGTVTEDELLDPRRASHLVAVAFGQGTIAGVAWADLGAGLFHAMDVPLAKLPDEFARLQTSECLVAEAKADRFRETLAASPKTVTLRPDWTFDPQSSFEALKAQFRVGTMTGFGFADGQPALAAAGAIVLYLKETFAAGLASLRRLEPYRPDKQLLLDEVTRRSLELTRTIRDGSREGSLLSVLDRTVTPMGARLLGDSLVAPLCEKAPIEARLDAVEELLASHGLRADLRELLQAAGDLQRLTARAATARATPRDLGAIARTLRQLPELKAKIAKCRSILIAEQQSKLNSFDDLRELLDKALLDETPISAKDGNIIRDGYHAPLDELRSLARDGKSWITRYQAQEITRTGIASLKVGYTGVIGYYIEITNTHEAKVPPNYVHERTLKNAKRYVTPELKEYEEKVLTAEEKAKALEFDLFLQLRDRVAARAEELLDTAAALAMLDMLASFAELAAARNYIRPKISEDSTLCIRGGRHPVLEFLLPAGTFVPNDLILGHDDGLFWLITGPNMSGKSTFIRQAALLTFMAHLGSFLPAAEATIGLADRIFTRVGASDELSRGQSTFMVEMTEAANILNNATAKSLVILDEIGRGTSTYDGVSLAWAIAEYLHEQANCRALFATHYHELAQLAESLPRLRNRTVRVIEKDNVVHFLHTIVPGTADRSYGIHVARLAGVPEAVLERAQAVLASLESPHQVPTPKTPRLRKAKPNPPSLFD